VIAEGICVGFDLGNDACCCGRSVGLLNVCCVERCIVVGTKRMGSFFGMGKWSEKLSNKQPVMADVFTRAAL